jgi:hypothetical protein
MELEQGVQQHIGRYRARFCNGLRPFEQDSFTASSPAVKIRSVVSLIPQTFDDAGECYARIRHITDSRFPGV